MKERFGAKKEKSLMLRFHTQTGGFTLTVQQPDNTIVHVAIQTLVAILGGLQPLHTNSRDEALSLLSEGSVRIALRIQQMVGYESGVAETIDSLAGSYYVESTTDRIEKEAMDYIQKIDNLGGAPKSIDEGYIQKEIQDSAYNYQKEIETGEKIAIIAVDPTSPFTGGAILGDRIRMNDLTIDPNVLIWSMGSRGSLGGLAKATLGVVKLCDAFGIDYIFIETVGGGQSGVDIVKAVDTTLMVMVSGLGDDIQAIKAGIMEIGDIFVVNKADQDGAQRTAVELEQMLDFRHDEG